MTCVSSHRCLGSPVVRKKEFRLKGFISLEEINLSRQKQNYRFYLFDKSWYFPIKHVIYVYIIVPYAFDILTMLQGCGGQQRPIFVKC